MFVIRFAIPLNCTRHLPSPYKLRII